MSKPISYCSQPSCKERCFGYGLCGKHYARQRRYGRLYTLMTPQGSALKFVKQALRNETDDCLNFPFSVGSHGYGQMTVDGESVLAHRYVCETVHGPQPQNRPHAAHSCGNKKCVNKKHIYWATVKENSADSLHHGTRSRGESHGAAKLNEVSVLQIRSDNRSQQTIARKHGVCQQTVSDIKCGRRWAWL